MILKSIGYRIEGDSTSSMNDQEKLDLLSVGEIHPSSALLEGVYQTLTDNDWMFFKERIANKPHWSYLGSVTPLGPVVVSIYPDLTKNEYVCMARTKNGTFRKIIPFSDIKTTSWRYYLNMWPSSYELLTNIDVTLPANNLYWIRDQRVATELLTIESLQVIKGFKFGVLYAIEGQQKEDDMFKNIQTSKEFEEFLDFLGDRVVLDDFSGFRGGLDIKAGTTGTHSIFTKFNNNEIMFHVSTMLPFNPKDPQQLERKRHIGNDIVVILFQEGDTIYKPTTISSRQVHVVFVIKVVRYEKDPFSTYYRLGIVSRQGVPEFGPTLEPGKIFKKDNNFRTFLFAKLLNAEKACYSAPILQGKLSRTRASLLEDVCKKFNC